MSYSVLINGSPNRYIQPQKGLRHGDPLSHFLFLICAEGFSALLGRREELGLLLGVRVTPKGTSTSYMFLGDGLICSFFVELMKKKLGGF